MLTDDLDGSEAEETVRFALDGDDYEIDLNSKNAAGLRKALDKFVAGARRSTPPRSRPRGRGSKSDVDPKAVRVWAAENGIAISSRGRISTEIIEQYRAS